MFQIKISKKEESEKLQKTLLNSFQTESVRDFGDETILPPGVADGTMIIKAFENNHIYSLYHNEELIGGLIVEVREQGEHYLRTLWIIPEFQDRKYGHRVMEFIFDKYSEATYWVLETPKESQRNQYFYQKWGFEKTNEENFGRVTLVYFRKDIS